MGKFGKKNIVSSDLNRYHIGFMAPSGFGKTTTMYAMAQELYGDEGYMILDMGMEDGVAAIDGIVAERVPNYGTLNEIVTDIVKNKETEYPNLKLIIIDTLDAYFEVIEEYIIKDWNAKHAGDANFQKATSINPVEGGFGRGMERVIDVAKKVISKLVSVGVGVWWTAHVKEKDQSDLYTGATYTTITANMPTKYFNAIKNSTHVVGCGYYDRTIEKIEVGEENPVTKKTKKRNSVVNEVRKIKFRDDMLVADAKSRFADIIDEIPLDKDAFIKAVRDAIESEKKGGSVPAPANRIIEAPNATVPASSYEIEDEPQKEVIKSEFYKEPEDIESEIDREAVITEIRAAWKELSKETKNIVKNIKGAVELDSVSDETLKQIKDIIDQEFSFEG